MNYDGKRNITDIIKHRQTRLEHELPDHDFSEKVSF